MAGSVELKGLAMFLEPYSLSLQENGLCPQKIISCSTEQV